MLPSNGLRTSASRAHILALLILIGAALGALEGCGIVFRPYRMDIQQGNFLDESSISKMRLGMTRDQVRFLLGTPLLTDPFHADRWDYVYRRQKTASSPLEASRLELHFKDALLVQVLSEGLPEGALAHLSDATVAAGESAPVGRTGQPSAPPAADQAPVAELR